MTSKWKFFMALNFIVGLPAFILLISLVISLTETRDGDFWLLFSVVGGSLLIIMLNSFFNIFLLQRFYPDKRIPGKVLNLNLAFIILTALITLGIAVMIFMAAQEIFGPHTRYRNTYDIVAMGFLTLSVILLIAILFMQGQLASLINRNHRQKINSLIDSIGQ